MKRKQRNMKHDLTTTNEPSAAESTETPDEALAAFSKGTSLGQQFMAELFRLGRICIDLELYESLHEPMEKLRNLVITYDVQKDNLARKRQLKKDYEEAERREKLEQESTR